MWGTTCAVSPFEGSSCNVVTYSWVMPLRFTVAPRISSLAKQTVMCQISNCDCTALYMVRREDTSVIALCEDHVVQQYGLGALNNAGVRRDTPLTIRIPTPLSRLRSR